MKFTILSIALIAVPQVAYACVTAHVYLNNCVLGGDVLSAQVFDSESSLPLLHPISVLQNLTFYLDDVEVCNGGKTIQLASDESVFCIDGCQPGYSFCVTHNAKSATYKNGDVYSVTMTPAKTHSSDFTCGNAGNKEIKGSEVETCFFDRYWNCNLFKPCDLCDFRSSCPR